MAKKAGKKKQYTFIDLFAGCGGLSEGFLQSGMYKPLAHVEWEIPMVNTLRHRLSTHWGYSEEDARKSVVLFDIQRTAELINGKWEDDSIQKYGKYNHPDIIDKGLKGLVGRKKVDLVIGGPPCQAYSIHGRATSKDSMQNDYRNFLFESFVKVVKAFKPDIFVFENVVGILSAKPGGVHVTERIYSEFTEAGYEIRTPTALNKSVFNAVDFGVPQNRPRVIILGVRKSSKYKMLETGTGSKEMKRIRHKYFRDDLKHLWSLLDSFFTHNTSDDDQDDRKEFLLIRKVDVFFEKMIDAIISDPTGVEDLKNQKDGKLIDHIFRYTSLVGKLSDIYYIGDSKYYMDGNNPEGVALYKQFTYARNAIQYHIERLYLENRKPAVPIRKGDIRYRDTLTEGYNITPNFFIRSRVTKDDATYDSPALIMTDWDEAKGQKYPKTNKHFEDRLFDRDTLLLREFSINFLFVIAAYAGYEDTYWASEIRTTIRSSFIRSIDDEYSFYILTPDNATGTVKFNFLYSEWTRGKIYTIDETGEHFILAFEKSRKWQEDLAAFKSAKLRSAETGEEVTYTLSPTTLEALDT